MPYLVDKTAKGAASAGLRSAVVNAMAYGLNTEEALAVFLEGIEQFKAESVTTKKGSNVKDKVGGDYGFYDSEIMKAFGTPITGPGKRKASEPAADAKKRAEGQYPSSRYTNPNP